MGICHDFIKYIAVAYQAKGRNKNMMYIKISERFNYLTVVDDLKYDFLL